MSTTVIPSTLSDANFAILSPTGTTISIPVSYDPETDPFIHMKDPVEIRKHYIEQGYVIQRNLIPAELCDAVVQAFRKEVKSHKGSFYRQASGLAEKHKFTANNHMLNAVMNVQDLDKNKFGTFQKLGLKILTHPNIRAVLHALIQDEAIVAQTMYFEGNPATWPHQDKDYLDATQPGAMVAAWVAVEDIQPGAGRFYVYPGSHKLDIEKLGRHLNIMLDKDAYIKLVIDTINKHKLECIAPALKKGDVLFWHGKTIHGSLTTAQPQYSRQSFTAHYMPIARTLLQMQVREKKLTLREVDGMKVNFPKDQNRLANKLMFLIETTFPKAFKKVKAAAIRMHKAKN
jgi:phytanoyl-CoA hydroxylase